MNKFSATDFIAKHYIIKESFICTLLMLLTTFGVSFIPLKYEFSKAIRQGFLGFDIYDLYFSRDESGDKEEDSSILLVEKDTTIVLVEIAKERSAIAKQINLILSDSPKVIGIDAVFVKEEDDEAGNARLIQAVSQSDKIVLAFGYEKDSINNPLVPNFFDMSLQRYQAGYINLQEKQYEVVRDYPPFIDIGDSRYLSFTSVITKKFWHGKYEKLQKRNSRKEIINYRGNLDSYFSLTKEQLEETYSTGQLGDLVRDKVVLLGYFKEKPNVLEDLHFTPMNERIAGKSHPDMYGVVIQANILSMILQGNYLNKAPGIVSYLLAGLIIFLFLWYILSQHKKKEHPGHGKFLLIQFLVILAMFYIFLLVFQWFQLKIPLLPIMIALVLCVELLGVYKGIALWMNKKYKYKTVFAHKLEV